MFRWYRGSALTIVHLLGVLSEFQEPGDLWRSIWNTRVWTYQEYVAARVVQFYTEDWKPYLGLTIFNHKESTMILAEMERATNFTTQEGARATITAVCLQTPQSMTSSCRRTSHSPSRRPRWTASPWPYDPPSLTCPSSWRYMTTSTNFLHYPFQPVDLVFLASFSPSLSSILRDRIQTVTERQHRLLGR